MELEVSALTRRDRLERIASAERDRRAGRIDLALATLGDASEWPARIVLALIRLPEEEGRDAREVLESTLDDWASETGLSLAEASVEIAPSIEIDEEDPVEEVYAGAPEALEGPEPPRASESLDVLESPIEIDELERAFAEAEAQTDEMHDVNSVAERVLMTEPMGLSELSGEGVDSMDDEAAEVAANSMSSSAWAPVPEWPSPETDAASVPETSVRTELAEADWADDHADEMDGVGEQAPRGAVLATLERWLANLEKNAKHRGRPQ